jgi:hypothetical protein
MDTIINILAFIGALTLIFIGVLIPILVRRYNEWKFVMAYTDDKLDIKYIHSTSSDLSSTVVYNTRQMDDIYMQVEWGDNDLKDVIPNYPIGWFRVYMRKDKIIDLQYVE